MPKNYVSNAPHSVRMFKSNFWESLSKVHFTVPLIIYIPVILFIIFKNRFILKEGIVAFICFAALGVFVWSLSEYLLHRFIFHFVPSSRLGLRMHFIFHGVFHDYPNDTQRLVIPSSVSIPLAFLFYFLFSLVVSTQNLYAFFHGFLAGYLVYDISHYAIRHFNFKNTYWKKIRKRHMQHLYADPPWGFGISSSFWDKVFQSNLKNY